MDLNGPYKNFKIVGFNLLVFAGYTIILIYLAGGIFGGAIGMLGGLFDAFLLLLHFLLCMLLARTEKNLMWLLSGLIILTIGCSICSNIDLIHGDMANGK